MGQDAGRAGGLIRRDPTSEDATFENSRGVRHPTRELSFGHPAGHSFRRARMGSMEAARRAGITAASAADTASTVMAKPRMGGS